MSNPWDRVHEAPKCYDLDRRERERAADEVVAATRALSRVTVPLVSHFDWDRARVNVCALVAPGLVRWK